MPGIEFRQYGRTGSGATGGGAADIPPERRLLTPFEAGYVLAGFRELFASDGVTEPHLSGVIDSALAHPGGLLRAQVAYGILRERGVAPEPARALAIALEYFHTASLLFDDLPAMDDARERRGHPCAHLVHGEAAAILGALALITRAYDLLWEVIGPLPAERRRQAARLVAGCLGAAGILDGQAHDLHFRGGADAARRVAEGKTVSLVRLTLVLPAVVAGLERSTIARLDRLATVWGLAYQALDDLKDRLLSRREVGKTTGRDRLLGRPNLAAELGVAEAGSRVAGWLAEGGEIVAGLARGDAGWRPLARLQEILDRERQSVVRRAA